MPPSGWEGPGVVRRAPGSGTHTLLVAAPDQLRAGTVDWVDHELAHGAKVFYKGWLGDRADLDGHWLLGPHGVTGAQRALARGQLDLLDFRTVVERCGGTTDGLFRLQRAEVDSAMTAGWSSVAMTQETTYRPMADDAEAAEFAEQEAGYDRLAAQAPLNTLCQLAVGQERAPAVWESIALHHGDLEAERWSARTVGDRWHLSGELDIAVATELGAAVHGAFRRASERPGNPHLRIDVGRVSFLDSACAQILLLAARSASRRQRLVVHRPSALVRELLVAVGLPRSVEFDTGGWG